MLCRAPTSSTTCSGTQTGAQLTYDRERRATHWQNAPTSPTSVDDLRHDGEGTRIEQRTVQGGTTTTTYYLLGGHEEVQIVSGGATTITKYYLPGATRLPQPINVGTTLSYLATDGLDTVSEAVDSAGNVTAQQLYLPYGGARYTSGTMPTSKGYTGQRADAATGLDYYGARYYDPVLGQFTSADTVADGLNRYGYVHGNPTTFTDPSGHVEKEIADGGGGAGPEGGDGAGANAAGAAASSRDGMAYTDNTFVSTGDGGSIETTESGDTFTFDSKGDITEIDGISTAGDNEALDIENQASVHEAQVENANPENGSKGGNGGKGGKGGNGGNGGKGGNLPTSVTVDASGTRVTTGTQEGNGPFFQSHVNSDSSQFKLEMAYRNGSTAHASEVFANQFELAGGQAASLETFRLENVEEPGTLEMWNEYGSVRGSPLDTMMQYLSNDLGVGVGTPFWSGNDLIYPVIP